ncbi:3-dehydroquinate synthase [Paludifilum halophilum]|uniref:3-dehydroquinate synthase n=1 Tax=Paludifilum halophilum TaxID=1642702 RepID=A0A235BDP0_9BACL|nr:3-dehydroquinate synthase [Paludifilum halophilum]OYD09715.1 3-dehydroquinate synthase [Paludifilum halophilum]
MKTLEVNTPSRSYPIHIGSGLYERLPRLLEESGWNLRHPLMLVTDSHVGPLYADHVALSLEKAGCTVGQISVPAGESSKTLTRLESMVEDCLQFGLNRTGGILALGGGVIGDLAGFLAASYMRGVPFFQLPTTLLAHDSSVGGKVGVNSRLGKNMIGAFYQPSAVIFDVDTLKTLSKREVSSGYAEVVKHALIWDASFADWLRKNSDSLMDLEPDRVTEAIFRGCRVKADVVSRDERETGLRAILNYGHTLGHALESVAGYGTYTHGEAVAIGMTLASRLGEELGTAVRVFDSTRDLLVDFGLPTRLSPKWSEEELLAAMRRDKKAREGDYTFVLPRSIGSVRVRHSVEESAVRRVLRRLKGEED